jgi:hypothetical protein
MEQVVMLVEEYVLSFGTTLENLRGQQSNT